MTEAKEIIQKEGGKVCFIVETGHMIMVEKLREK